MRKPEFGISRRNALKLGAGAATAGVVGIAGCTDQLDDGDNSLTIASTESSENIQGVTAERFAEHVEEESDGEIDVDVSLDGAHGSVEEIADLVNENVVQMQVGGVLPIDRYASEYYFVDSPFVIEDYDHLTRILNSDEFEPALDELEEDGNMTIIGDPVYRGNRQYTSNEPVESPEDVEGMDLRLPELDTWVETWEEIGVNTTPVALDELYSALQQGVAEASEGDIQQIQSQSLHEVQDYLSLTEHLVSVAIVTINVDFYERLDETHQDIITEAATEETQQASEEAQEEEEELIQEVADEGMEVIDDVDNEAFWEQAEPAIDRIFEEQWAESWDYWQDI